jgi:hypothetical protein
MANLPSKTRNSLLYRPNIHYIEPEQEPEEPHPIKEIGDDLPLIQKQEELLALAEGVDLLGKILQERIDEKSKNIKIKIDPVVDFQVMQSMCRLHNQSDDLIDDCNFLEITYDQYRQSREAIFKYGEELGLQARPDGPEEIDEDIFLNGGLRPELSDKAQVIKPIDMEEFRAELFKLVVRHIWSKFFLPKFRRLPVIGKKLPKQLPGTRLNRSFRKKLQEAKDQGVAVIGL